MNVLDKNGVEMTHPDVVADMVNDSMRGAIQLKNYKLDYQDAYIIAFEKLLAQFDWSYNYSDDHNVWKRGVAQKKEIMQAMKDAPKGTYELILTIWETEKNK